MIKSYRLLYRNISHKLETYESFNNFYPPHKILKILTVSGFAALATIASSVAVALPAAAVSFNFSFTGDTGLTVNSVLTTSDPSPTATANQTYTITGISGTVNGNAITGLSSFSPFGSPDNTFQWDGTTNIGVTNSGISFATASLPVQFFQSAFRFDFRLRSKFYQCCGL
jgi:hypothetical protein